MYSINGTYSNLKLIEHLDDEKYIFQTNEGTLDIQSDQFFPRKARYIRFYTLEWSIHNSLRIDVYVDDEIQYTTESNRKYSSVYNDQDPVTSLYAKSTLNSDRSWSGKKSISDYIQLDLQSIKTVTGFKILPRGDEPHNVQYVKKLSVEYSIDGINFLTYVNKKEEEVQGNGQFHTEILNWNDFSRSIRDPTVEYDGIIRANISNYDEVKQEFKGPKGDRGQKGDPAEYYLGSYLGLHVKEPKSFIHMQNKNDDIPTQVTIQGRNNSSIVFTENDLQNDSSVLKGAKIFYDITGKLQFRGIENSIEKSDNLTLDFNKGYVGIGKNNPEHSLDVANNLNVDGASTFKGEVVFKGGMWNNKVPGNTHFPWGGDNRNYIRGDTVISGDANVQGNFNTENNIKVLGTDFEINNPTRKGDAPGSFRRAMVHGEGDKLNINHGNDYTGGVNILSNLDVNGDFNYTGVFKNNGSVVNITGNPVPLGSIIMWSGDVNKLPDGYALCDGNNGKLINNIKVPDLRSKFLVGFDETDDEYNEVGKTGGEKLVKLNENQIPKHKHTGISTTSGYDFSRGMISKTINDIEVVPEGEISRENADLIRYSNDYDDLSSLNQNKDSLWNHWETVGKTEGRKIYIKPVEINNKIGITIKTPESDPSEAIITGEIGSGNSHENRPPFYTIAFIIRVQ